MLALGALTALHGVGCALAQRDCKRLLAYSSVENIGIIFMGVGLGWAGRAMQNPWIAALGFGGALLHVWNHAAFKSLLFFGAGSVLHATGTRDMERMGGLAARMPATAMAVFPGGAGGVGAAAVQRLRQRVAAVPGLFRGLPGRRRLDRGLALTALAVTGGLAGVAFAKFFGFVFLGAARSPEAEAAHDPGPAMLGHAGPGRPLPGPEPGQRPAAAAAGPGGGHPVPRARGRCWPRAWTANCGCSRPWRPCCWAWAPAPCSGCAARPGAPVRPGTWDCG